MGERVQGILDGVIVVLNQPRWLLAAVGPFPGICQPCPRESIRSSQAVLVFRLLLHRPEGPVRSPHDPTQDPQHHSCRTQHPHRRPQRLPRLHPVHSSTVSR
jgi:hypothetical protein